MATNVQTVNFKIPRVEASLPRYLTSFAVLLLPVFIWLIWPPVGVQARAWHLFAICVATIVGIILKPHPTGAIGTIGVAATAPNGTRAINQALSGFGNSTIWLMVVAFFISRGFFNTGLGSRNRPPFDGNSWQENLGTKLRTNHDGSRPGVDCPRQRRSKRIADAYHSELII
jgi:hypothetical protein